jgi:hypothetical protein
MSKIITLKVIFYLGVIMIKILLMASALFCGACQAEIYKCTVKDLVTYGDVPCAKGTGGPVAITYDTPSPEQIAEYSDKLKRLSDDADARINQRAFENSLYERNAHRRATRDYRQQRKIESDRRSQHSQRSHQSKRSDYQPNYRQ